MGWQQGLEWLGGKVRVVGCKDFAWVNEQGSWRVKVVPVGDGIVQWRAFFRCLHQMGFDGLISVHSEYAGWNAQQVIAQTRDDLQRLKAWAMEGQNTSDR
jgi:sugar phosphate isomerase/epimerase